MDFELSEEQQVVAELATTVFTDMAAPDRVAAIAGAGGFDRELWRALADANLLGLCLPESWGGSGMDAVELALMAEQQGRRVAPVPLVPTVVASMVIANHGSDALREQLADRVAGADAVVTAALTPPVTGDGPAAPLTATSTTAGLRFVGMAPSVPFAPHADWLVLPARRDDGTVIAGVIAADASGVSLTDVVTTDRQPRAHVEVDTVLAPDAVLGTDAVGELWHRTIAANAAIVVGVARGALEMTAAHVSTRHQFKRPLSSFQAVTQRAADAYISIEAMRVTMLNAAWHLAAGSTDAEMRRHVEVAAFWASEGGQQVAQACQHLHGGVGADVTYPVHRYYLWATQLGNELGSASAHLAQLGALLAAPPSAAATSPSPPASSAAPNTGGSS